MVTTYCLSIGQFDVIDGVLTMMSKRAVKVDGRRMVDLNRITPELVAAMVRCQVTDFNDCQEKREYALNTGDVRSYFKPWQKVNLFSNNENNDGEENEKETDLPAD
jgi:hypothetical protein